MNAIKLSPKENEVLDARRQGWSEKEVAGRLGISVHTVKAHLKRVYLKLGVHSITEALREASPRPFDECAFDVPITHLPYGKISHRSRRCAG